MKESFQVSYAGQSKLGAAEQYVDAVLLEYDMPTKGITAKMTAVGDRIFICFGQKWKGSFIVDHRLIFETSKNKICAAVLKLRITILVLDLLS